MLYQLLKTNSNKANNHKVKRVEILFNLKGNTYEIKDTINTKNIVCIYGSCELQLTNDINIEKVCLDNIDKTAQIDSNIRIELKNYTDATKIVIEYLGKTNG